MTDADIQTLLERLATAEQDGDVAGLDTLTTSDFILVGPLGFLLPKDEWLDRYRSGALTTEVLTWQPESVRRHNDTAIVIGRQEQRARYQGHPVDARFRTTHVLLRRDDQWRVASTHLSPSANLRRSPDHRSPRRRVPRRPPPPDPIPVREAPRRARRARWPPRRPGR